MAKYRYVSIVNHDGSRSRIIVEEQENYAELITLSRLYGIRYTVGRRLSKEEIAYLERVQLQQKASPKGGVPTRPLSPDFGRGSGAPI